MGHALRHLACKNLASEDLHLARKEMLGMWFQHVMGFGLFNRISGEADPSGWRCVFLQAPQMRRP